MNHGLSNLIYPKLAQVPKAPPSRHKIGTFYSKIAQIENSSLKKVGEILFVPKAFLRSVCFRSRDHDVLDDEIT